MTRPDGTPVNAVYGFTNMLLKLIDDADAEFIAVIFDAGSKSFRNDLYADYKAQRPPPPPELIPQFSLIRDATRACNVPAIELAGFEADDLLATYARQAAAAGHKVTIVSSDKDLMQLVGGTYRDARSDQEPAHRRCRGDGEIRRRARQGGRRPGAGRRFHRQRAGRAGHRRQDRGRADQYSMAISIRCWPVPARSSSPSGARRCSPMPTRRGFRRDLVRLRQDVPVPVIARHIRAPRGPMPRCCCPS